MSQPHAAFTQSTTAAYAPSAQITFSRRSLPATSCSRGLAASRPAEHAQDLLDERERACGVPFPAAVRVRYAQQAGLENPELYGEFANRIPPSPARWR